MILSYYMTSGASCINTVSLLRSNQTYFSDSNEGNLHIYVTVMKRKILDD